MPQSSTKPARGVILSLIIVGIIGILLVLPTLLPGNRDLYDAIEDSDEAAVRQLLNEGTDPNSRARGVFAFRSSRYLSPPLIYALERSEPGSALLLLAAGADPDSRAANGRPAIIVAVGAEMTEVVGALIEKGADVHAASTSDGETALRHGPKGPGGKHPGWANRPKDLKPEVRAMLEQAGAQ